MSLKHRYDFVLAFDVKDGNPNGNPDDANAPRTDPETGHGLVTDVCIKRKVRNFVALTQGEKDGFHIYVKERAVLSQQAGLVYEELGLTPAPKPAEETEAAEEESTSKRGKRKGRGAESYEVVERARDGMCKRYFDVRAFGAVMSLKEFNAGQVRGPVQMTFARSVDPVSPQEHTITRVAVASRNEAEDQGGANRTMGQKHTVPYGLYVMRGFISPQLAAQTGFGPEDLELFWKSLACMFEHDRSAARGFMCTRELLIFEHESPLGNAPSHRLFDLVRFRRKVEGPARDYTDYALELGAVPPGVTLRHYQGT